MTVGWIQLESVCPIRDNSDKTIGIRDNPDKIESGLEIIWIRDNPD
jgi:hypothetical protein